LILPVAAKDRARPLGSDDSLDEQGRSFVFEKNGETAPAEWTTRDAIESLPIARLAGSRSSRDRHRPEPAMSLPRRVAEILREHVTLEVEGIDRLYLNV
jgi:hypothetical protein